MAIKVNMDWTTAAHKNYVHNTAELSKIKSSCEYSVLGYRIDLYFHDYKITTDINGNGCKDRNIDFEIKRQKAIE